MTRMDPPNRRQMSSGVTNLMLACQRGRDADVKAILAQKPFIASNRDRYGKTAVHYCAENSSLSCAYQVLSVERSLVNVQDADGYSPLHLAIISGNKVMARFLLRMGADVNAVDNEKHTCVHWATVCADVESLEILIDAGAKITTADIHGAHPIHYVAQMSGRYNPNRKAALAVLRLLLQHGAQVDCQDQEGRQPLLWAACSGSSDAILSIVSAGGTIDAKDNDGLSALHYAASRGHTDCVDALITLCGANIDETDNSGCTALYYSVAMGQADCTQLLLKYGSDADHRDLKGRTPAHCGAAKGHLEMLKILETHGANLWIRNLKGDLPLHEAVHFGRKDLVCWLLDQKNNAVNAPNIHGKTSLHIAATNNNIELCQVLIDRGASLNALMKTSKSVLMTPLDAALSRRYRRCAKYLQSQGALPANKLLEKCEMSRSLINLLESCARPSSSEGTASPIANSEGGESLPSPSHQSVHDRCEHFDSGVHVRLSQMDIWDLWESLTQSSQRLPSTLKEEESQREDSSNQLIINNIYVYKEEEKTRNTPEVHKLAGDTGNYKKRTERLPTVMEQNKESNLTAEYTVNLECQSKKENNIYRHKYDRNRSEKKAKTEVKRSKGNFDGSNYDAARIKESDRYIFTSEMDGGSDNLIPNKLNQNIHNEKSSLYVKKQMNEEGNVEYKTASRILNEEKETSTDDELSGRQTLDQDHHRQKQKREQEHKNFINVDSNIEEHKEVRKRNREKSDKLNQDKNANYLDETQNSNNYRLQNREKERHYKFKEELSNNLLERTAEENGALSEISLDRTHKKERPENLNCINKNIKYNTFSSSTESSETLPTIKHTSRSTEKKTSKEKFSKPQEFNSSSEFTLPDIHAEENVSRMHLGQKNTSLAQTSNEIQTSIQEISSVSDKSKCIEREDSLSSFASETISVSLSDSSEDISSFRMLSKSQKSKRKKQLGSYSSGRETSSSSDSDRLGRTILKMKRTRTLSDNNSRFENQVNTTEDNLKSKPFKSNKSRRKSVIIKWKKATEKVLHYIKNRKLASKEMKYSRSKNAKCQTDTNYERKIETEPSVEEYSVQNSINFQQEKYLILKNKSKAEEDLDEFQHTIEIDHSKDSSQQSATIIETKDEKIESDITQVAQNADTILELSSDISRSSLLSTNLSTKEGTKNICDSLVNIENSVEIDDSPFRENILPNKMDNLLVHDNRTHPEISMSQETEQIRLQLECFEEKVSTEDTQTMQHELPIIITSEFETSANQEKTSLSLNNETEKENLQNFEVSQVDGKQKNFPLVDVGIQIDERFHSDFSETDDLKKKIEWSTIELKEEIGNISSTVTHHIHTTREELSRKIDNSSAKLEEETKKSVEKLRDLIFSMKTENRNLERKEMIEEEDDTKEIDIKNFNKVCIVSPVIENCNQENKLQEEMKVNLAEIQKTEKDFEKVYSEIAVNENEELKEMPNSSLNKEYFAQPAEYENLEKNKFYVSCGNKERTTLEKSIEDASSLISENNNNNNMIPPVQSKNNFEINNVCSKSNSLDYMENENEKQIEEKKVEENIEKYYDGNIDVIHKEISDDKEKNGENNRVLINEICKTSDSKLMVENKILENDEETKKSSTSQNKCTEENFLNNKKNSNSIINDKIIQNVANGISERMGKNEKDYNDSKEESELQLENKSERKETILNGHSTTDAEKEINQNQMEIKRECERCELKTMIDVETNNKGHKENDRLHDQSFQHSAFMQIIDKDLSIDPSSLEERINQTSEEGLNETKRDEEKRTGSRLENKSQDHREDFEKVEKLKDKEFQKSALELSNSFFPSPQTNEILEPKEINKESKESIVEELSQKGTDNAICSNLQQDQLIKQQNYHNINEEKLERKPKCINGIEEPMQTELSMRGMSEHLTINESSEKNKENGDNFEKCEEITNSKIRQETNDSHNSPEYSRDIKSEKEIKDNQNEKEMETITSIEKIVFNKENEGSQIEITSPDNNREINEDIIANENYENKNKSQKRIAVTENNSNQDLKQSCHIIQENENNHDRDSVSEDNYNNSNIKFSNQEYQNIKIDTESHKIQNLAEENTETADKMLKVDNCQEEENLKENLSEEKNEELSEENRSDLTENSHLQFSFSQYDKDSKADISCNVMESVTINPKSLDIEENKDLEGKHIFKENLKCLETKETISINSNPPNINLKTSNDNDNENDDSKEKSNINEMCPKSLESENSINFDDKSKQMIDSNLEDEREKHGLDKESVQESKNIQEILSSDIQEKNKQNANGLESPTGADIVKHIVTEEKSEWKEETTMQNKQYIFKKQENNQEETKENEEEIDNYEEEILENTNKKEEKEKTEKNSEDTNEKENVGLTEKENIGKTSEKKNENEELTEKEKIETCSDDMNEKEKEELTEKESIEVTTEKTNEGLTEKENIEEKTEKTKEDLTEEETTEKTKKDLTEKESIKETTEKTKEDLTEKENIEETTEKTKEDLTEKESIKETTAKTKEDLTEKENIEETTEKTKEDLTEKESIKETTEKTKEDLTEKENIEETTEKTKEDLTEKESIKETTEKTKEDLTEKENIEETTEKTKGDLTEKESIKETTAKTKEDLTEKENIEETTEKTKEDLTEKESIKETTEKTKEDLTEKENIEETTEKTKEDLIEKESIKETTEKTNEDLTEKERIEETSEKTKEDLTEKESIEETTEKTKEDLTEKENIEETTEKTNEDLTEKERIEETSEKTKEDLTEKESIEETTEKTNKNKDLTEKGRIEENSEDTNKKEKKELIEKVKGELSEKENIKKGTEITNENEKLIGKNEETNDYHKTDIERRKSVESEKFIEKKLEKMTEIFLEEDGKEEIKTEEAPDETENCKINVDEDKNLFTVFKDESNEDFPKINKEKLEIVKDDVQLSYQEEQNKPEQEKIGNLLSIQKNEKKESDLKNFKDSSISERMVTEYKQSSNIIQKKVEMETNKKSNRNKINLQKSTCSRAAKIKEEKMVKEPIVVQQPRVELRSKKITPDGATYSLKVKSDGHVVDNENTTKNNKIIKPKRGGAFSCRNQWWEKTAFSGNDGANRKESRDQKIKKSSQTMPGPIVPETEQSSGNTGSTEENGKKDPEDREKETTEKAEDAAKNSLTSDEPRSKKEKEPPEKIEIKEIKESSSSLYVPNIIQSSSKIKEVQQDRTTLKKFRQCYAKHKSSLKNVLPQTGKKITGTGSGPENAAATSPRRVSDKSRTKRNVSPAKMENPSSVERSYVIEDTEEEIVSYMSLEKQRKALSDRKVIRRRSREIKSNRGSPGQKSAANKTRNVAIQASGRTSTRHRVCFGDGQYPVIQCVSCKSNEQSTTQVEQGKRICMCDDEEQKNLSYLKKEFSGKMSRNLSNHGRVSRRLATIPESKAGDCIRSCARTRPILPSLPTPNIPSRYGRQDRRLGSILDQIQSLTSPVSFLVTLEGSSSATRHRLSINITPTKSKSMDDIVDKSRRAASVPRMKKGISLPNFQTTRHSSQKTVGEKVQKRELPRLGQQKTADNKETKLKRSPGKKKPSRNAVSFTDDQKAATSYNRMEGDSQPVTFHLDHGRCRDTFRLPTEPLKDKRKWEVTFTIKKDFKNKETEK